MTQFGIALYQDNSAPTLLREIEIADRLGFDSIWMGDSQTIWRDPYVILGAAAVMTKRAKLGISVTNPITRHPSVTASAATTLQELAAGRFVVGVGIGFSALQSLGLRSATRSELRLFVQELRRLMGGADGLTYAAPNQAAPILIGGSGPKMLRIAGEIGDGVIIGRYLHNGFPLARMLDEVWEGRNASRDPSRSFRTCLAVGVSVSSDRQLAYDAVRPHVARSLMDARGPLTARAKALASALRDAYDIREHLRASAQHALVVPDEVVAEVAVAGTAKDCLARLMELLQEGVDEITFRPYAVRGGSRLEMIEALARDVVQPLREMSHSVGSERIPLRTSTCKSQQVERHAK